MLILYSYYLKRNKIKKILAITYAKINFFLKILIKYN